jgi:hypothetical protein
LIAVLWQARNYLTELKLAFEALQQEASATAEQLSHLDRQAPGGSSGASCDKMRQLAGQLEASLAAFDASTAPLVEAVTILRERALPAAEALAQQLWQHWHRPGQEAAARLELAAAAAVRSCAYVRCAQLSAQGGPAAGEGVGSKRCSGCKAVWYCGTECFHADWRAGHSKVCKALAAERAARDG